ncbi:DUF1156 domain-containing protein [Litorilinea aerophila]|uniref:DUF1156 domain-containing protein n=1 Tax=Litorilinea aerophila TaxID=1204385 RepID=A0A540VCT7_9CHLR|nr:DUF1156 domain-containing protein [Litorilinea aerophila]MCC9077619.1 DUF1156 domain-containing protein [Litorilinea aerophila]
MIEHDFDISFIANLALREKQIQQNYRPVIAVHKWFARRPGTLFRGLLLSEFGSRPLTQTFFDSNDLSGIRVADPFMGGGTPLLEANRMGCEVIGFDINPMSYWIVKQELEHLDLAAYERTANRLLETLEKELGHLYKTQCIYCGSDDAHAKYFLWVKTRACTKCGEKIDLFPGFLVARNARHPKNVIICMECGELNEVEDKSQLGKCRYCRSSLRLEGPARRGVCQCPSCGTDNHFPTSDKRPEHKLFAIEYYCPICKPSHQGRFFKKPDELDLERIREADSKWQNIHSRFVPDDPIPSGDETNRLHRWGYRYYREMFNSRQLLGLEMAARFISRITDERVRGALATNLSDLLRYQNMLCRYDTMALKSLDIFSVHGFPVGLIQCESNMLGIVDPDKGTIVGSGGWANIIEKFRKAKSYCDAPFEVRNKGRKKEIVPIPGEWIGDYHHSPLEGEKRKIELICGDAAEADLPDNSLDAVLTDPPYFGNVQYAELMDFCYVWLRRLVERDAPFAFLASSTRRPEELTVNEVMGRGLEHFTQGLSTVFRKMARALKPGAPLAFTYHHNDITAYLPLVVAILDAELTCTASLPCPAEMGASIHINGTGSSIVDTVFVCRSTGSISEEDLARTPREVAVLVKRDVEALKAGGVKVTEGDLRCIVYGHLTRLAIWGLRHAWDNASETAEKLSKVEAWLQKFGSWEDIRRYLNTITGRDSIPTL